VQLPIAVREQLEALNAWGNVFAAVKLFPPAAMALTSISTEVHPDGVVNEYQTSYVVPHVLLMPELVDWYKSPGVLVQFAEGVREGKPVHAKLSLVG